jgi:hypothetical protein
MSNVLLGVSFNDTSPSTAKCKATVINTSHNIVNTFMNDKKEIPSFLEKKIISTKCFISLNKDINYIKTTAKSIVSQYNIIIFIDNPINANSYNDYKNYILPLLLYVKETLLNYNIYIYNEDYFEDIMKDIETYNGIIKGLYVKSYGVCADKIMKRKHHNKSFSREISLGLLDLYASNIDIPTLQNSTKLLNKHNVELIIETNSICSYTEEVSNTFGAQLWLVNFILEASIGNVNSVVIDSSDFNNIYSYMLINFISKNNLKIYQTETIFDSNIPPNIDVYLGKNSIEQFVIVIHKDTKQRNVSIEIDLSSNFEGRLYKLITNQLEESKRGFSFGELTFDNSVNGKPINIKTNEVYTEYIGEKILPDNNKYKFIVNNKSIAVLHISNIRSGGAYFEDINNSDVPNVTVTGIKLDPTDIYDVPITTTLRDFEKIQNNM